MVACIAVAAVAWVVIARLDGADGPEGPVLVGDVLSNPARYDDGPIRVSDQVQTVQGPFFTLGGEAPSARLLAYQPPRSREIITRYDAVDVVGRVTRFEPAASARRFGGSFERYANWASRLVLVPERIDPSVAGERGGA